MAGILRPLGDESVTVSGAALRRLLEKGDGDAALLYLALLRHQGLVPPRSLAGELRWERSRIEEAEASLRQMELVSAPAAELPEPADEKPDYRQEDITEVLERDEQFRVLTAEVERKLGKKLSTPDLGALLGLYDYLGLPSDVIYLLVCHCAERIQRRYGEGRRPTLRQIEKEGYSWVRMGIDTQTAAAEYLKKYALRQESMPAYMRVLQMGDRLPVAAEEKYLAAWQEWGFPPEVVAEAYEKTVLKCHELKWPYINGILKKWHEAGLHTLEQIAVGDRPRPQGETPHRDQRPPEDEMRRYVQALRRGKE